MKRTSILIILALCIGCGTTYAQFAKPLPQTHQNAALNEAKYNIGIVGGMSATRWFHFGGTETKYDQPYFLFDANKLFPSLLGHGLVGLVVERRLGDNNSVGIEALYANRSTMLSYDYELPVGIGQNKMFHRQDSLTYSEICLQIPITQYFGNGIIKPYIFIAPRFTLPVAGKMHWQRRPLASDPQMAADTATVAMTAHNMKPWNVGAVVGAGVRFKVPISSYYLLLKLDASCHFGLFNTYSDKEIAGETDPSNVIGASHIDPYLLGKRHIGNATVKLTVMFPLSNPSKGACMNWGEYD